MATDGPTLVAKPGRAPRAVPRGAAEAIGVPSSEDDGHGEGLSEHGSGGGAEWPATPNWLQPILRILAETQQKLALKSGSVKPRKALASLRLEELRRGRETTPHHYRAWQ